MTLNDLLALHGEAFIKRAYGAVLGREVDETGLHYYTKRLEMGVDRADILADLSMSDEAHFRNADIPGLWSAVRKQRLIRLPVIGTLFCLILRGCTKRTMYRINALVEKTAALTASPTTLAPKYDQALPLSPVAMTVSDPHEDRAEFQFIRGLVLLLVAHRKSHIDSGAGDGNSLARGTQVSSMERYRKMMHTLSSDRAGNLMLIEAPEIYQEEQLQHLPPSSAAVWAAMA